MQWLAHGESLEEQALPLIGGRRFWGYPSDARLGEKEGDERLNATFEELDALYRRDRSGPIGLCVPFSDPELMRRLPEAIWPETKLLYAGTDGNGTQLRLRYFHDATVGPGLPNSPSVAESEAQDYSLPPGYRMEPLAA